MTNSVRVTRPNTYIIMLETGEFTSTRYTDLNEAVNEARRRLRVNGTHARVIERTRNGMFTVYSTRERR